MLALECIQKTIQRKTPEEAISGAAQHRADHRAQRLGRQPQRGGTKLNLLLTLAVVGAMLFTAVKIVPPYFANWQFQDAIETEARFAIVNRKVEDDVRNDVFKKMQELGIPGKRDDIRVSLNEGLVNISLNYTVPIDLQVYQFILDFHPHADNRTI